MERWQLDVINSNMVRLIAGIQFNASVEARLISHNILARADVEQLRATQASQGDQACSSGLLNILVSRVRSYRALGQALYETCQSDGFLILLNGLITHLLSQHGIVEASTMNEVSRELLNATTEDAFNFFLVKTDRTTLSDEHWIPPRRQGIYIPRHISNRTKLDPAVFQEQCSDIFAFLGLSRFELTNAVHPNPTTISSNVISNKNVSKRFVYLEEYQHWEKLKTVCGGSRSVHLVQFEKITNEYLLVESTGSNDAISKHIPPHMRDKSLYISEEQFVQEIVNQRNKRPICICDTPGMGKTWLLENLARAAVSNSSNRLVAFIALPQFIKRIPWRTANDNSNYSILLRYIWPSGVMPTILPHIAGEKINFDLFLDGFDEIPKKHLLRAKDFFQDIATTQKNVRLFVTSRPHMRKELEQTFGAVARDILPFSAENQVEYIVGFWKASLEQDYQLEESRMKIFAEACLRQLKATLSKEEGDLMGIPLQCFLLASVNLDNVLLFCCQKDDGRAEEFVSPTSMPDMFYRYVERNVNKAVNSEKEVQMDTTDEKRALVAYHVWKALQMLFPDFAEDYFQSQNLSQSTVSQKVLACGLLQTASSNDPEDVTFIHRTFAEYMAAEAFADVLTGHHKFAENDKLKTFLFRVVSDVLRVKRNFSFSIKSTTDEDISCFDGFNFRYAVIASFLNASLRRRNFVNFDKNIPKDVSLGVVSALPTRTISSSLSASIADGHEEICRLVKHMLCRAFETKNSVEKNEVRELLKYSPQENSPRYKRSINEYDWGYFTYICLAAKYSNDAVREELYSLFEECLDTNLDDICAAIPTDICIPLHYALARPNYDLVEYFSSKILLQNRKLLYFAVRDTLYWEPQSVSTSINCCQLLMGNCSSLLSETTPKGRDDPVLAPRVHVELIKFLIEAGANIHGVIEEDENLVAWHVRWLKEEEFGELCRFVILERKAYELFRAKFQKWSDPLLKIIGKINLETLAYILQVPDVKLDYCDAEGNSLILVTILGETRLRMAQMLVDRGVNILKKK